MANQTTRHITANIWNNFYLIICDKYTDISNREQLSFCIRWVDNFLAVHEKFLRFYEVPNVKSETLVKIIKDIFLRFRFSLQLCRGQCFDGASNILRKRSGVFIQIYKEQQRDTHCHFHSLNLSIKDVKKTPLKCFLMYGHRWRDFCSDKFSKQREKRLENLQEPIKNSEQITPNKITKSSTTRLTVRESGLLRIIENYSYIIKLWNESLVSEKLTTEIKSRVIACQNQLGKFDLFFGLHLGHRLYSHTANLS